MARFYDSTVPEDRPDRVSLDLCADADGPVLELACGTGDVYLDLLDAGVDAYGIDASPAMLEVLRENAAARFEPRVDAPTRPTPRPRRSTSGSIP